MKEKKLNHMDIKPCNILVVWDIKECYSDIKDVKNYLNYSKDSFIFK